MFNIFKTKQQKAYKFAETLIGVKEILGSKHEKKILGFFETVGHSWVRDDETAWCAAFVGHCLEKVGLESTRKLNARSYLDWGIEVPIAELKEGDIVVFSRGRNIAQGHVAFFVGFNQNKDLVVLGGNQGNMVSKQAYAKERFLGGRRYK